VHPDAIRNLLSSVADGKLDIDQAMTRLKTLPFEQLDFATLDHHRTLRCGFPEVILGQGKTDEQIEQIFARLAATGSNVLATRVGETAASRVLGRFPAADHNATARTLTLRPHRKGGAPANGRLSSYVAVVAAGTSDLPVAEEARVTIEIMDQRAETIYDVGVAGLHRLLARSDLIRGASVLVVAAGMEGALPSVVGGLVSVPVIAVPTSVGYGASFGGIAALLGMLNTCAAGVSVVNIDNGFGAGYQAALIARAASENPQMTERANPQMMQMDADSDRSRARKEADETKT
jgi:hypothetical protein